MARIPTRTVEAHDDWFGTDVPDPYRWLEDTDDPEVAAWLAAQAADTRAYLDTLPARDAAHSALSRLIGLPRSGLPVHRGGRWFRTDNDGTHQQDVLVVSDEPFGTGRVLVDPNPLTADASTGIAAAIPSPDGSAVAFAYIEAGSDWHTWRVRDVVTGTDFPDEVRWSKFTYPVWLPDSSGFIHGRFAAPDGAEFVAANEGHWLDLHRIGASQQDDVYVFGLPGEPDITFEADITEDGRWLVVLGTRGTDPTARMWVRDLRTGGQLRAVIDAATATWHPLGSTGDEILLRTDSGAPLSRVVALDPLTGAVREVVAEQDHALEDAVVAGGRLVLHYLHDAASELVVRDLDGTRPTTIALPGLGTVAGLEARAEDDVVHLGWTSFTAPPSVLSYDVRTEALATGFAPRLDSSLVTEQIVVTSADGTTLPVFLLHRPDVTPHTGPHPTWLYGYGGFRVPITPAFEPTRFAFADAGGVCAIACLRGGGEYGASWHDAGRLASKQNVFDDAIATAEHLIATGWTDSAHLAASGRSNGGLLAGALLTQRPDLFAAVVPEVGVLDMLRFPLWTIGWAWTADYGDPRVDSGQFRTLYAYSPLHRLRADVDYPPVLILTSDHDDRVVPAHSLKFAARLQAVSADDAVALLRVEAAGGHKEGRSTAALTAERTDVLAFLTHHTDLSGTGRTAQLSRSLAQ